MEPSTLVRLATLLLLTPGSAHTNTNHSSPPPDDTHLRPTAWPVLPSAPAGGVGSACPVAPQPAFLLLRWTSSCAAEVQQHTVNSSTLACLADLREVKSLLRDVCENRKGCSGVPAFREQQGEPGRRPGVICAWLSLTCTAEADGGQLQAYKVSTALLTCVLLVLLLMWLTRPTVRALQKRLSNRRKTRWIGPKQSQSVSYHCGENGVERKRSSYPALDRLTVGDCKDSSSNRNSDLDL